MKEEKTSKYHYHRQRKLEEKKYVMKPDNRRNRNEAREWNQCNRGQAIKKSNVIQCPELQYEISKDFNAE